MSFQVLAPFLTVATFQAAVRRPLTVYILTLGVGPARRRFPILVKRRYNMHQSVLRSEDTAFLVLNCRIRFDHDESRNRHPT